MKTASIMNYQWRSLFDRREITINPARRCPAVRPSGTQKMFSEMLQKGVKRASMYVLNEIMLYLSNFQKIILFSRVENIFIPSLFFVLFSVSKLCLLFLCFFIETLLALFVSEFFLFNLYYFFSRNVYYSFNSTPPKKKTASVSYVKFINYGTPKDWFTVLDANINSFNPIPGFHAIYFPGFHVMYFAFPSIKISLRSISALGALLLYIISGTSC